MKRPHTAILRVDLHTPLLARKVLEALNPETRASPNPRSTARIEARGRRLIITIEAQDTTALRAALNSYGRWAMSISAIFNLLGEGSDGGEGNT